MTPTAKLRRKADSRFHPEDVNFWCHVLEGALAVLGFQLVSGAEVLPVLVTEQLGFSKQALGWVNSIIGASFLLPLLLSPLLETGGKRKRLILILGVGQRLPLAMIAVGLLLFGFAEDTYHILLGIIAISLLVQSMAGRANGGPWMDLIAETIPSHRQGHLWGRRGVFSAAMRIAGAPLCFLLLRAFVFPYNYALVYGTAFGLTVLSWCIFAMVDEVPDHVPSKPRRPFIEYFRELMSALKGDPNFSYYIVFSVLRGLGATIISYVIVVAIDFHGVDKLFAIAFLMISRNVVRMVSALVSPYVAGRIGYKRLIVLGSFLTMVSALTVAFAPRGNVPLYMAGALIWSLGGQARQVGAQSYLLRLLPRGRRVGYQAVLGAITAVTGIASMPAMGYTIDKWGHGLGFYLGAVFTIICVVPLMFCKARDGVYDEQAEGEADGAEEEGE